MKKLVFLAVVQLLSVFAYSYCKETSPGVFESSNSMRFAAAFTTGNNWYNDFMVTNISDAPVVVKITLTDDNGNAYFPTSMNYQSNFSNGNTPVDLENGALLLPGELGRMTIRDPSTYYINVGTISWQSNECIYEAIMLRHRNTYSDSGRITVSELSLNDGQPF